LKRSRHGIKHDKRTRSRRRRTARKLSPQGATVTIERLCQQSEAARPDRSPLLRGASKLDQKRFLRDNKGTLELAGKVDSWLMGWLLPAIIILANCMSINLKMGDDTPKRNSCMVVAPKGTGKSELLERVLAASNPEHFRVLPHKIFESQLVQKPREYFHNKILVLHDLIIAFEGMDIKQRQQLQNFWNGLLEGNYARDANSITRVSILVLFGLASEKLNKFRSAMLDATFFDRVPPFKHNVTREMKRESLRLRSQRSMKNPPVRRPIIKLPLPDKIEDDRKVDVAFPRSKEIEDRIVEYAMELDRYEVQSAARAQDYIKTFMRANALLNRRSKATKYDLYLYDLVHPLFVNSMGELGMEKRVEALIKNNPDASDKELMEKSGISRKTFYKYKKVLLGRGVI
jgi:hypothetical protein